MCTGAELIKYIQDNGLEDFTLLISEDVYCFTLNPPSIDKLAESGLKHVRIPDPDEYSI